MFRLSHPEAMVALFAAAERLLELTGDAVALCPVYGTAAPAPAETAHAKRAGLAL